MTEILILDSLYEQYTYIHIIGIHTNLYLWYM
jgi:hypothetical protein